MSCCPVGVLLRHKEKALEKYLATPLRPMNLREMLCSGRQHIRIGVEQLAARTARSYMAFSSEVLRRSLDREIGERLLPLESICKREFECCLELSEFAEVYLKQMESGGICVVDTPQPNEVSDDRHVDRIMKGEVGCCGSPATHFIDVLENLRPHENLLDIVVNEGCIRSPDLNHWLSCFCRRRVSWRVIHEHLLHLVGPNRYSPVIREDHSVGGILQQTGTVVMELYTRLAQEAHGGSLTIKVEEQPALLTQTPGGWMVTSSNAVDPVVPLSIVPSAPSSGLVYSVEGHLEYIFRELMKNACVAMLPRTREVELHVRFASNDTHVMVDVTDTAGGISLETLGKLWLFGWSTNTPIGDSMCGFGVGLPASKVYMDLWGGRIKMYSAPGTGTTVRVTFPKAPTEICLPR